MKHFFYLLVIIFYAGTFMQTSAQQIDVSKTSEVASLDSNITFIAKITPGVSSGPFYVVGNNLYLNQEESLKIYDISDPASPSLVAGMDLECCVEDVFAMGNYVYVTGPGSKLVIIDVSDPSNPVEMGSVLYNDQTGTARVVVSGNYAYMSNDNGGLRVVDVSDPSSPVEVGSYITPGVAKEVDLLGNYAFVADGHHGLRIIDVSEPSKPIEISAYQTSNLAVGVYTNNNYAYVGVGLSGMQIIDVSDPFHPFEAGVFNTNDNHFGIARLSGFENYVYVPVADVIYVVDVSVPASPVIVGYYTTGSGPYGLIMDIHGVGQYIYASDHTKGLYILKNDLVVGVDDEKHPVPVSLKLFQNYPNPFNPTTTIEFRFPAAQMTSLTIYNVLGQKVRTLINQRMDAGVHSVQWDGRNDAGRAVSSGVYLYRLQAGQTVQTKKMLLVR